MHRIRYTKLTPTQISAKLSPAAQAGPASATPLSDTLAGKSLQINTDGGPRLACTFKSKNKLVLQEEALARVESGYGALTLNGFVLFFGHLLGGAPNHDCVAIAIDFENALTTCVQGWLGTKYMANEAARKSWFGVIEMDGVVAPQYRRHQFTDELVGTALTWNYSPGLTSMHVYTTPHSFSWIIFLNGGAGGLEWSGPAQYVKLRDDLIARVSFRPYSELRNATNSSF